MAAAVAAGQSGEATAHQREEERQQGAHDRDGHRAGQQPGRSAHDAAGHERSRQPAQRAPQHAARHQRDDQQYRRDAFQVAAFLRGALGRRRQRFTVDEPHDAVGSLGNAAVVVPFAEPGRNDLVQDAIGGGVVQHAFQAVAHLYPHPSIVLGDQEQHAIVHVLAAGFPGLGHPQRILLDALGRGAGNDKDGKLAALAFLEVAQLLFQSGPLLGGQRRGQVGDQSAEGRNRHQAVSGGLGGRGRQPEHGDAGGQPRSSPAPPGPPSAHRAPAGLLPPKSTVGGVEMALSLATEKLALTG